MREPLYAIRAHVGALGALIALCYARHHAFRSTRPNGDVIRDTLRGIAWRLAEGA